MATRQITVKASDINKDAPAFFPVGDGTDTFKLCDEYPLGKLEIFGQSQMYDIDAGSWVDQPKHIHDALMRRAQMAIREIERAVIKSMYSHDNPRQIVIESPNYRLAPGAVGIGQMVDLQGVV